MNIEIKDDAVIGLLKTQVNNIAQKIVGETVRSKDISKMADELMQKKFNAACNRIINDGSFYDKVAAHLAAYLSDSIAQVIIDRIDLEQVTRMVSEVIADRISKSLSR